MLLARAEAPGLLHSIPGAHFVEEGLDVSGDPGRSLEGSHVAEVLEGLKSAGGESLDESMRDICRRSGNPFPSGHNDRALDVGQVTPGRMMKAHLIHPGLVLGMHLQG